MTRTPTAVETARKPTEYSLYGLKVIAERPLPGLPMAAVRGEPEVCVSFSRTPLDCDDLGVVIHGGPALEIRRGEAGGFFFRYSDLTEFFVSAAGDEIRAFTPEGASLEDTCVYLVGPIMGLVMRLHGAVCLHASTVLIGGGAVAFCGPPGAGKSTTAAAFARRHYPVLAEDVAVLEDGSHLFSVRPGYPRVNLWPESVSALFGPDSLPKITPNWSKSYLPLNPDTGGFHPAAAALRAIYILDSRGAQRTPEIHSLDAFEALLGLASNTYTPYLLDPPMRAREFDVLTRLAQDVPVRRVHPPVDIADIGHLCDGILANLAALS